MKTLYLDKEIDKRESNIYSICFRGARYIKPGIDEGIDLYIYEPNAEKPLIGEIIFQKHLKFSELQSDDITDNYNVSARRYLGLLDCMREHYSSFEPNEIVSIIKFKVK